MEIMDEKFLCIKYLIILLKMYQRADLITTVTNLNKEILSINNI